MLFVLLRGVCQYGALGLHLERLASALREAGHQASVIDTTAEDSAEAILSVAGQGPDVFLSINGTGCGLKIDGVSAYDRLDAVFASIYVDNPIYHLERLAMPSRRKAALFLDESHVELVRGWSGGAGFRSLAFLPPGATLADGIGAVTPESFARRDIDILFTGTYRGEPRRYWLDWPQGPSRQIMEDVADRMIATGDLPVREALIQALMAFGAEPTPQRLDGFMPVLGFPQQFVEEYFRDAFVRTLGQAGTRVTAYGRGWDGVAARFPSFEDCGVGSFAETLELLPRARIVLNTNNGFVAGGHERVFTAMGSGAYVFSEASAFYARRFEEDREISTFRWADLAAVPQRLEALRSDGEALAARAAAGQRRARAEHSWSSRVEGLLAALDGV